MNVSTFGKILAIFVAVASISFFGFAAATYYGRPNWEAMTKHRLLKGYGFTRTTGDQPQWEATRASDQGKVATSPVLPAVLNKVLDEIVSKNRTEMDEINTKLPLLKEQVDALIAAQAADEAALTAYEANLRTRLAATRTAIEKTTTDAIARAEEAQKLENQISARREDVFRLRSEVEELNADMFRLQQIRNQLQDLMIQIEGDLSRAQEREHQLDETLRSPEYSPSPGTN